jgi:flagellar hook protein FlgE
MSLFDAMNNGLSGLASQSNALSAISNNIANSSTVGYKETDAQFESMVLNGTAYGSSQPAGVTAIDRMDVSSVGQVQTTGVNTDIAVNGDGMMVVNSKTDSTGQYLVTRAGSFRPDAAGNLVNAGGYYLQGIPVDATGTPINNTTDSNISSLSTVNVGNLQATASPTTKITFNANLPATDPTTFAAGAVGTHVSTVQYYDSLGNAQTLTYTFQPVYTSGSPNTFVSNEWNVTVQDSATAAASVPSNTAGIQTTVPDGLKTSDGGIVGQGIMTFYSTAGTAPATDAAGNAIAAQTGGNSGTIAAFNTTTGTYASNTGNLTITTGGGQTLDINVGAADSPAGMTQFAGNYSATNIQKNGASFGLLQGVSVSNTGQVIASFSNGSTRPIYQLELAVFPNEDGLNPVSGGAFQMSPTAGVPRLYKPGDGPAGATEGGALEGSNVDIATQLTNLIETQRAYSSSATVIQTSGQMLDVVNHLNQ